MFEPIKNFGKVEVSTGYDDNDVSIVLTTGHGALLPDPAIEGPYRLVWWNSTDFGDPSEDADKEIVLVTGKSSDTLTVVRGYDGTPASNKDVGGKTYSMILALTAVEGDKWVSNQGNKNGRALRLGTLDTQGASLNTGGRPRIALDANGKIIMAYVLDDISKARSAGSFDTTSTTSDNRGGITFKPDGKKMYVLADDDIYQFSLSTPWDVSTASYDSISKAITGNDRHSPRFNAEGTIMLVADDTNNRIEEYTMATPWDLSTLTAGNTFSVASQGTGVTGMDISPDGRNIYICNDAGSDSIFQYKLKEAWDISTAYYYDDLSVSSNNVEGIAFNPAGTRAYVLSDFSPEGIMEFALTVPWDISTGSFVQTFTLPGNLQDDIIFAPDGSKVIIREVTTGTVVQYDLYDAGYTKLLSNGAEFGARISGTDRYYRIDSSGNVVIVGANASIDSAGKMTGSGIYSSKTIGGNNVEFSMFEVLDDFVGNITFKRNGTYRGNISVQSFGIGMGGTQTGRTFVINSSGNVAIGASTWTSGGALLTINGALTRSQLTSTYLHLHGSDSAAVNTLMDAANAFPIHNFRHSGGTFASPTASAGGSFVGGLGQYSYDGSAFNFNGRLAFHTPTTNANGSTWESQLLLYLVGTGSTTLNAAAQFNVGNTIFTDALLTKTSGVPTSGLVVTHLTRDMFTGLGNPNNSYQHFWHRANTNGIGLALTFNVSTTVGNLGAIILHRRTGANSQGTLDFYTKNSTTGADPALLAMIIDQNQNVYIGNTAATTPAARLHIAGTTDTTTSMNVRRFSADASGGFLAFYKSRGTEASPNTAASSGDVVGGIRVSVNDGTSFAIYNGMFQFIAGENQGTSNRGVYAALYTTRNAGTANFQRLIFGQGDVTLQMLSGSSVSTIEQVYQQGLSTTNATPTAVLALPVASGQCVILSFKATARRTDVTGTFASYKRTAVFKNIGGTVTQVGTTVTDFVNEDDAALDCDFNINGTNVEVLVTGKGSETWAWRATATLNN